MKLIKQSSTARVLAFLMVDSTDHVTGKTLLTPTVTLSKNGAGFGACAGAVSEVGSGWYKVAGNATDSNTLGSLALHATGAGADPTDTEFEVVAFDPQDATSLGISRIDAAISSRSTFNPATDTVATVTSVTNDVGITQTGADKVWSSAARTLTSFGTLVSDIWASGTRTLTSFGTLVADVWAYATRILTAATNITSDGGTIDQTKIAYLDAAVSSRSTFNAATDTVANVTTTASVTNDVGITQAAADKVWNTAARTLTSFGTLAADVWAYSTRSLTTFGTLVSDIWSAATRTLSSFGTLVVDIDTQLSSTHSAGSWSAVAAETDLKDTATTRGIIARAMKNMDVSATSPVTGSVYDDFDAAKTAAQAGDAMTLTTAYDAAKTAAQAGEQMDLVDVPNPTAVTAIQSGLALDSTVAKEATTAKDATVAKDSTVAKDADTAKEATVNGIPAAVDVTLSAAHGSGDWDAVSTNVKLASDGLDNVVVETGVNARQSLAAILATTSGVSSGQSGATPTFKNPAGSATRVVGTVDEDRNRTAVTLTLPV